MDDSFIWQPSLTLLNQDRIAQLHKAATTILAETGLNVHHPEMRRKLADLALPGLLQQSLQDYCRLFIQQYTALWGDVTDKEGCYEYDNEIFSRTDTRVTI